MMQVIFLRPILHKYANEDVSLGSWFIGLEVNHIDERNMCCGTPPDLLRCRVFNNVSFTCLLSLLSPDCEYVLPQIVSGKGKLAMSV